MRRAGWIVGVPLVILGAVLVLDATSGPSLRSAVVWFVGGVVAHDAVIAPVTLALGLLVHRAVPPSARAPVQVALVVTGCLVVATFPLVLGRGRNPAVPSQQPLDYSRNLLVVLAIVWVGAAVTAVWRQLRQPVETPAAPPRAPPH